MTIQTWACTDDNNAFHKTADLKTGRRYQEHAKNDTNDRSKRLIIKIQCRSGGVGTGQRIVTKQATETNEVVLGIFVVVILGNLRGKRGQSSEVVLNLLTLEQSVVVLEVVTDLGKRRRVVGGRLVLLKLVEGELECRDVGWLVSKQMDGGNNQRHVQEG